MPPISYARHKFPPVGIQHAVWLYVRFTLSYRDVENLLAERGLDVSYESIGRRVLKFGPPSPAAFGNAVCTVGRVLARARYKVIGGEIDDRQVMVECEVGARDDLRKLGRQRQRAAPAVEPVHDIS